MSQWFTCKRCGDYRCRECHCKLFELTMDGTTYEQYALYEEMAVERFAKDYFYDGDADPRGFELKISVGLKNYTVTAEADVNFYVNESVTG